MVLEIVFEDCFFVFLGLGVGVFCVIIIVFCMLSDKRKIVVIIVEVIERLMRVIVMRRVLCY